MKLTLVGGGGFRAPMVYEALRRAPFGGSVEELVLYDVVGRRLDRVAGVVAAMDEERPAERIPVRRTTGLEDAVADASFVLCAIRVGGLEARAIDERVPLGLGVLGQETTGPAGVAFALRTVPAMLDIARTVASLAPEAWFVNLTNPAGLVTEAVQAVLGDRALGICDSPASLCSRVAAALGRRSGELTFDYVGLNHYGWLNRVLDADGRNLLPGLLANDRRLGSIDEARLLGADRIRGMRAIPNEYLVYHERAASIASALRARTRADVLIEQESRFYDAEAQGSAEALAAWRTARDARHATYMAEGWTTAPPAAEDAEAVGAPGEAGYAAVAMDVIGALSGTAPARPLILDVGNRGAIPWLDDRAVVEVPCEVSRDGITPMPPGPVGREQRRGIETMKQVERLTIRAALERSADLALEAIAVHPLVPSRMIAERIWAGYRSKHLWLREAFR